MKAALRVMFQAVMGFLVCLGMLTVIGLLSDSC